MKFQARVFVTLRTSVLDPAGTAIKAALAQMGTQVGSRIDSQIRMQVESVRIGKYVEIVVAAANESEAKQQLEVICDRLLANPVIEEYRFELQEIRAN
jgi:phosphoribosylformylglycinamidine synthase subunit PurS